MKASIGELSIDFPNKQRIKPELKPSSSEIHEVSPAKCFDEVTIFFSIGMNFVMVEDHARDLVLPRASLTFFEILPGERYRGLEVVECLVRPDSHVVEHRGDCNLGIAIRSIFSKDLTIVKDAVHVPSVSAEIFVELTSPLGE